MSAEEIEFHKVGESIDGANAGKLFGKLCYKIGKKAFCCFFNDMMVFKLSGEDHKYALALEGSVLFDPSGKGRPMKEWVQVSYKHSKQWSELALSSVEYVKDS